MELTQTYTEPPRIQHRTNMDLHGANTEPKQIYMEPTWVNMEPTRIYMETTQILNGAYMDQHGVYK